MLNPDGAVKQFNPTSSMKNENQTQSKHTPGAFQIMADFKSYEIAHWLETITPSEARALFESGAELEQQCRDYAAMCEGHKAAKVDLLHQRDELREALNRAARVLRSAVGAFNYFAVCSSLCDENRAASAKASSECFESMNQAFTALANATESGVGK